MSDVGRSRARDVSALVHPFTDPDLHAETGPLIIDRGEGAFVIDVDGRRYLEGMAGLWNAPLGFSEERLIEAAGGQMRRLPTYHLFGGKSYLPAIELASRLLEIAPVPMSKVLFTNSGSEANDTAIKLVRAFHTARGRPGKTKIIARLRGYHGVTMGAASLTGLPHVHGDFGLPLAGFLHTDCPHHYRFGWPGEGPLAFASRLADRLERLILREGPETVGGFIAEPVMGAGGVIIPPPTYFAEIQRVLKRYEVLFIADEVITGFARTGRMFGTETYGLEPDLITLAKGLSAGYAPIGAVLISEPVWEGVLASARRHGTFGHGFTSTGHPVASAIALRTLKIFEEDGLVQRVQAIAPRFEDRLMALGTHALVGHARSVGLVGAIELMADRAARTPFDPRLKVGARVAARALAHGVILRPLGDVISFCPPLIVGEEEIDRLFDAVGAALDEVATDLAEASPHRPSAAA